MAPNWWEGLVGGEILCAALWQRAVLADTPQLPTSPPARQPTSLYPLGRVVVALDLPALVAVQMVAGGATELKQPSLHV